MPSTSKIGETCVKLKTLTTKTEVSKHRRQLDLKLPSVLSSSAGLPSGCLWAQSRITCGTDCACRQGDFFGKRKAVSSLQQTEMGGMTLGYSCTLD